MKPGYVAVFLTVTLFSLIVVRLLSLTAVAELFTGHPWWVYASGAGFIFSAGMYVKAMAEDLDAHRPVNKECSKKSVCPD